MRIIYLLALIPSLFIFLILVLLPLGLVTRAEVSLEIFLVFGYTALLAFLASLSSTLLGYLFAYHIYSNMPGKTFVEAISTAPLFIPHTAIGALLASSFSPLNPIGLNLALYETPLAIYLAMTLVSLPIARGSLATAMTQLDPDFEVVMRSLGASRIYYLFFILPRALISSMIITLILSWARAFSEAGSLLVLARRPLTVGVYIFEAFTLYGVTGVYFASLLSLAIGFLIFWISRWLISRSL